MANADISTLYERAARRDREVAATLREQLRAADSRAASGQGVTPRSAGGHHESSSGVLSRGVNTVLQQTMVANLLSNLREEDADTRQVGLTARELLAKY